MFGSYRDFLHFPFHLLFLLGSGLQTSVLVATVANKYRRPSAFIQTKTLRRMAPKKKGWLTSMMTTHVMKNYDLCTSPYTVKINGVRKQLDVCPGLMYFTYLKVRLQRIASWELFCDSVRVPSCRRRRVGRPLSRNTSNLSKDNLLGRSPFNLSSRCSAIGSSPCFKVNLNSQNVSLYLSSISQLSVHGHKIKKGTKGRSWSPSNLAMRMSTLTEWQSLLWSKRKAGTHVTGAFKCEVRIFTFRVFCLFCSVNVCH